MPWQRRGDDCIEIAAWPEGLRTSRADSPRPGSAHDSEAEQKLVQRLETIRGQRGQHYDPARSDADYAQAFRDAGLDLDATDPKQAGDWIKQRRGRPKLLPPSTTGA